MPLAVHWDILQQDLRYTARTLSRARGFALTAIVIVALGVGANTAAFSVTDFVLFRPLPFPDADRLVTIWQRTAGLLADGAVAGQLSATGSRRPRRSSGSGIYTAAWPRTWSAPASRSASPARAVSADLFPTLGVQAALGRIFADGRGPRAAPAQTVDPERPPVAHARSAPTRASSGAR